MKYLLIFITLLFFANLEFAFAGQISPASHLKPKVEIAPQSTLLLSPSPQKGLGQKMIKNAEHLMLAGALLGVITFCLVPFVAVAGMIYLAFALALILGLTSLMLGIIGLKKDKIEKSKTKILGIIAVIFGGLLSLITLPIILTLGMVLIATLLSL